MKLYNKIFGNKANLTEQDIEKYLSGNADAKEQHNIEAKALQNQLFADAIDGYAKNKGFDINKFKNRTSKRIFKNNSVNYLVAIAAMFALVTILFFIPFNNKNNELAEIPTTNLPVKEKIVNEETVKIKLIEHNDEKLQEQSEEKEIEKPKKSVIKQIIVVEKTEDLIANNSRPQKNKKTAQKPIIISKVENVDIQEQKINTGGVAVAVETEQNNNIEQAYSTPISKAKKADKYSGSVIVNAENTDKINQKEKTFENNFPILYLADNSLKVANYSGKREPKDELELEDARSMGTSARFANKKVAEAEMQTNSVYMFEEEYFYNDFLDKALFKFKKEKYSEAIRIFDVIIKQYPDDINAIFYNGLSFYKLKKYNKAINYFDLVINDNINIFDQEAEWSKALCLLETNRSEGEKLLQKIVDEAGFYSQKAMILLNE